MFFDILRKLGLDKSFTSKKKPKKPQKTLLY